jgi:N-methylhydantoinase B/oxoprolinase/acetone carboxylase alpha subunit
VRTCAPAPTAYSCWVERAGGEIVDRSGEIEFPVEAGDVVGVDTPGGGGFG